MVGSVDAFQKLGVMTYGNGEIFEKTLPIIYHHLDVSKIPSRPKRSSPDKASELALMSLFALFHGVQENQLNNPNTVSSLLDNWSMIWTWTSFLVTDIISSQPELGGVMTSTPGLVSMLTRLWVSEPEMQHTGRFGVNSLEQLLLRPGHTSIDDFVATIGGCEHELASLCISRVNDVLRQPNINYLELGGIVCVILCSSRKPKVNHAFLANHSISVVTQIMSLASCGTPSKSASGSPILCLKYCTAYLKNYLVSTDGFTWIIQAVEGNIIPTILKSMHLLSWDRSHSPASEDPLEDDYVNLLRNVIAPYLVYRSVLRQVARSIKKVQTLDLESCMGGNGSLWDAWLYVKDTVEERMNIKASCDDKGWSSVCENRECSRTKRMEKSEVMRCSGCLNKYFCSRECQKYAWKNGHREICKEIVLRRREGLREPISLQDIHLLSRIFRYDVCKHIDKIVELRLEFLEKHPYHNILSLVTKIDYTVTPPAIVDVGSPQTFKPGESIIDPRDPECCWDWMVEKAEMGRGYLVWVIVPHGEATMVKFLLV